VRERDSTVKLAFIACHVIEPVLAFQKAAKFLDVTADGFHDAENR